MHRRRRSLTNENLESDKNNTCEYGACGEAGNCKQVFT